MTDYYYDAESGTVGNPVSTGDGFTAVTIGTGCTATIDNTSPNPLKGAKSFKLVGATGAKILLQSGNIASLNFRVRAYLNIPTLPGNAMAIGQLFDSTGGAVLAQAVLTGSNKLQLQGAGGVVIGTTSATSGSNLVAGALQNGVTYRLALYGTVGTTTTNGAVTMALYAGDSTTALDTVTSSAANLGTATAKFWQWSKGTSTGTLTINLDSLAFGDTAAPFGPDLATTPTALTGAAATAEPWSTVTHTGSATGGTGTGYTYAWAQLSGPAVTLSGASSASVSYTAPAAMAGGLVQLGLIVHDGGGAASPQASVVDTVLPATEAVLSGGVWTPYRIANTWP